MSDAQNELEMALYSRLAGTAAVTSGLAHGSLSVYSQIAPQGADTPYLIFSQQSGIDENVKTGRSRQILMLVKVVSNVSMKSAGTIGQAIDDALHVIEGEVGTPLSISGWSNFWQRRDSDVRYTERDPDGKIYHHAGGLYRFRLSR